MIINQIIQCYNPVFLIFLIFLKDKFIAKNIALLINLFQVNLKLINRNDNKWYNSIFNLVIIVIQLN